MAAGALVVAGAAREGRRPIRSLDRPALVALLLGLAGIGYRLVLLLLTVPGTNSDEATFGLVATHIAQGRTLPVYLYGQHYMGVLESYLAAPFFALFGPSWVLLRAPLLVLYAAFVYLMYRLTREIYSPWLATFTVGLLALGSERVVRDQMTAAGGRPETKPAVVLLLLLAIALAQGRIRRRWLAFAVFGLVAGASLWTDWLVIPYLAAAAVVLLAAAGRELRGRAGLALLAGFAIGALPLIVDNLTAPPGQDSLSVFRQLSAGEGGPTTLPDRLHGAVLQGIPLAAGLCRSTGCAPWQMAWGALYPPLLVAAAALAVVHLRRARRTPETPAATAGPARWIRYVAQLALVGAAAVTLASYVRSSYAATAPLASARYLATLQISLPVALWPLWRAAGWAWRGSGTRVWFRAAGVAALGLLAAMTAAMLFGTASLVAQVGPIRAEEQRARTLATALHRAGIRYVYGEYWTCNRLTFTTREKVICAVLTERLKPGQDRYGPYGRRVHAERRTAFVFATGETADLALRSYLSGRTIHTRVTEVGGYRIYQPDVTVQPWR
ncbi:hypothetical protein [Micromonospora sp. NPDC049679]|uniref:hypothetical protein n=1 Tax=Micromonospora sp. NPDC049679 TaxID=3155920 RepID=UPI0033C3C1DF